VAQAPSRCLRHKPRHGRWHKHLPAANLPAASGHQNGIPKKIIGASCRRKKAKKQKYTTKGMIDRESIPQFCARPRLCEKKRKTSDARVKTVMNAYA